MVRLTSILVTSLLLLLSFSMAQAGPPFGPNCTFPSCIVTCPRGDIPTTVIIRDAAGVPCPAETVFMVINGPCATAPCFFPGSTFPIYTAVTNAAGVATFNPRLGGCCAGGSVDFIDVAGNILATVTPGYRSPDISGDCTVNLIDVGLFAAVLGGFGRCEDFNCDGIINIADVAVLAIHFGH